MKVESVTGRKVIKRPTAISNGSQTQNRVKNNRYGKNNDRM